MKVLNICIAMMVAAVVAAPIDPLVGKLDAFLILKVCLQAQILLTGVFVVEVRAMAVAFDAMSSSKNEVSVAEGRAMVAVFVVVLLSKSAVSVAEGKAMAVGFVVTLLLRSAASVGFDKSNDSGRFLSSTQP